MGGSGTEKKLGVPGDDRYQGNCVSPHSMSCQVGIKKPPDWREVPVEINLWRPRRGSNPQPSVPKTDALSN